MMTDMPFPQEGRSTTPSDDTLDGGALVLDVLGSPIAGELFRQEHLSRVVGLRLADGRAVVLKVRPFEARHVACGLVQRQLSARGIPFPALLWGPTTMAGSSVSIEEYVEDRGASSAPTGEASGAAGLWVHLFNAQKAIARGQFGPYADRVRRQVAERLPLTAR